MILLLVSNRIIVAKHVSKTNSMFQVLGNILKIVPYTTLFQHQYRPLKKCVNPAYPTAIGLVCVIHLQETTFHEMKIGTFAQKPS